MAKLDLDWLQMFVELYRVQSVTRAAERLGMAQATASIVLNKLRAHFGDPLFSRTSRGMEPTPHAQALYPELLDIVERLDRARGAVARFHPATAKRVFRICITDISEIVVLPALLNRLRREAPGVVIEAEVSGNPTTSFHAAAPLPRIRPSQRHDGGAEDECKETAASECGAVA